MINFSQQQQTNIKSLYLAYHELCCFILFYVACIKLLIFAVFFNTKQFELNWLIRFLRFTFEKKKTMTFMIKFLWYGLGDRYEIFRGHFYFIFTKRTKSYMPLEQVLHLLQYFRRLFETFERPFSYLKIPLKIRFMTIRFLIFQDFSNIKNSKTFILNWYILFLVEASLYFPPLNWSPMLSAVFLRLIVWYIVM